MIDMDRASFEGRTFTLGDARLYDSTNPAGPTSAHDALAQASALSLQLIENVIDMIPGIGTAYRL